MELENTLKMEYAYLDSASFDLEEWFKEFKLNLGVHLVRKSLEILLNLF